MHPVGATQPPFRKALVVSEERLLRESLLWHLAKLSIETATAGTPREAWSWLDSLGAEDSSAFVVRQADLHDLSWQWFRQRLFCGPVIEVGQIIASGTGAEEGRYWLRRRDLDRLSGELSRLRSLTDDDLCRWRWPRQAWLGLGDAIRALRALLSNAADPCDSDLQSQTLQIIATLDGTVAAVQLPGPVVEAALIQVRSAAEPVYAALEATDQLPAGATWLGQEWLEGMERVRAALTHPTPRTGEEIRRAARLCRRLELRRESLSAVAQTRLHQLAHRLTTLPQHRDPADLVLEAAAWLRALLRREAAARRDLSADYTAAIDPRVLAELEAWTTLDQDGLRQIAASFLTSSSDSGAVGDALQDLCRDEQARWHFGPKGRYRSLVLIETDELSQTQVRGVLRTPEIDVWTERHEYAKAETALVDMNRKVIRNGKEEDYLPRSLVVTSLQIPRWDDGLALLQQWRAMRPTDHLIVLSARAAEPSLLRTWSAFGLPTQDIVDRTADDWRQVLVDRVHAALASPVPELVLSPDPARPSARLAGIQLDLVTAKPRPYRVLHLLAWQVQLQGWPKPMSHRQLAAELAGLLGEEVTAKQLSDYLTELRACLRQELTAAGTTIDVNLDLMPVPPEPVFPAGRRPTFDEPGGYRTELDDSVDDHHASSEPEFARHRLCVDVRWEEPVVDWPREVLVLEDEDDQRTCVSAALRSRGFEVIETGRLDDAIKEVDARRPRLMVLDLMLPGAGTTHTPWPGLEVLRHVRNQAWSGTGSMVGAVVYSSLINLHDVLRQLTEWSIGASNCLAKSDATADDVADAAMRVAQSLALRCTWTSRQPSAVPSQVVLHGSGSVSVNGLSLDQAGLTSGDMAVFRLLVSLERGVWYPLDRVVAQAGLPNKRAFNSAYSRMTKRLDQICGDGVHRTLFARQAPPGSAPTIAFIGELGDNTG